MLWWRYPSPVHHFSGYFHHTSSHRHHQMSARNVGSVSWNKLMTHNSMHIKTNISKHFTQEQTSLPTSGREIPRCHP